MAALELIIGALKSIPETIWAVALGSALTILGVVLSNRHHRAEQSAQRAHDSTERDKERKFNARADVYLQAAAEMAQAQQHLGNLTNLDLSRVNAGELLSGFLSSSNKAILIASDEAALAINDYLSVYMTSFFRLLPKALPIHGAKADRDIHDNLYQKYHAEVQRVIASMTHINEANLHAETNWEALERTLEFNQEQMNASSERRGEAWDTINTLTFEYMDAMIEEAKSITRATVPALIAIRDDLQISSDIESYGRQFEERLKLVDQLIVQFKSDVKDAAI